MNRLSDLKVVEVSLVPKAANKKKFLLFKSETEVTDMPNMEEILKAVLETELDNDEEVDKVLKASLSDKAANAVKGALRLLGAYKDELPKDIMKTLAGLAGYGYPAPAGKAQKEEKTVSGKPITKENGSIDLESVPEEVRPAITALWKENQEAVKKAAELEKALTEEHDHQMIREFIVKANEFKGLPIKPEEFGPVLKSIAEKDPEAYAKLDEVLKAADEAAIQAKLLEELGASGVSPSSSMGKIEAMAATVVEKDASMTREQAMDKVLMEHPELYNEYRTEHKAGR